ncbi:MAG: Ig-like domain-containing protein [Planctomycetota bacterium]
MKTRFLAVLLILSCLFAGPNKNYACILNDPPDVEITTPSEGSVFAEGDNVTIEAYAFDPDGYITKVEFYQGTTKLGEDTEGPPYSHIWSDIPASPPGGYSLKAKAFDDDGATTISPAVGITVTDIWYVDAGAMNVNGQHWGYAFNSLQDALERANSGDEIRVAKGIYRPDEDKDNPNGTGYRGASFELINGVAVYGGFAGYTPGPGPGSPPQPPAPDPDTRDITTYQTVLSGDLNGDDDGFTNNSENSYHVVTGEDNTILDGFTISGGNADDSQPDNSGGGIYCASKSPTISNCTITNNNASLQGGGFYCSNASPTISNCTVTNNNTDSQGGGFYCSNASPTISKCSIKDNTGVDGGGMFNSNSGASLILTNCIFSGNKSTNNSTGGGGGIHNYSSSPTVENCTFSGNSAVQNGGGIYNGNNSTPTLTNCILWGNTATSGSQIIDVSSSATVNYSDVQGGWTGSGTGNIDDEPLFVNTDTFYLGSDSPCINAGDPAGSYDGQTDIGGEPRVLCLIVDMGVDEVKKTIYVDGTASGGKGLTWLDAYNDLQNVLTTAVDGEEIWVADGTYLTANSRTASFNLKPGMLVYGGFKGGETSINERNLFDSTTASILSGDIGVRGDDADNNYHVVVGADGAVLDGFTIEGGNADGSGATTVGGGMYNNSCSPTVANCIFRNNNAHYYGGGMYNFVASPMVVNCFFSGNTAGKWGGGISGQPPWGPGPPPPGDPHYYPAGSTTPSNPSLINCTFSGNSAVDGYGMSLGHNSTIVNCIFWDDADDEFHMTSSVNISYSDIRGCGGSPPPVDSWDLDFGIDGGNNIDLPPLFEDAANEDFRLKTDSPCIDKGVNGENMGANWQIDATIINGPVAVTNPVDLAIGSNGDLYVLSSSENSSQVLIYNDQLVQQSTINVYEAENPEGIALDGDNNIYIADTGGNCIHKYDSGGTLDATFGNSGSVCGSGSGEGQFDGPWGIAVDWSGYIYVTDSGNDRVQIFEPDGQFDSEWGELGSGDGQLDNPTGFCLFGSSEIYLADTGNDRIQNLSAKTGYYYGGIGENGDNSGQFDNLQDACYDLQFDQLIVADTDNDRIQIFQLNNFGPSSSSEITYIDQIVEITGPSPITLSDPMSVVCKSSDTKQILYIADNHNGGRVVRVEVEKEHPGRSPLHVWAIFKAALWVDDLDKALTFIADMASEEYTAVLTELRPEFQNIIAGMGDMVLISREQNIIKYEMLHDEGTQMASFPVYFCKDGNGNWKIYCF